jgi:hypothetical protein
MPAEPAVGVWLADLAYGAGRGRPADDASHWLEGAVQIRVRFGELEGWYPIHYPVTAEFWWSAGRSAGLPKRRATAAIVPDGKGWTGTAHPRGTTGDPSYRLDWQPADGVDQAAALRAFGVPTDPMLVLNQPLEGPDLMRVQYLVGRPGAVLPGGPPAYDPAAPKPERGLVRLRVRDDLDALQEEDLQRIFSEGASLGDLIATDQVVPGTHTYASVALGNESEKIGEGGYPDDGGGEEEDDGQQPGAGTGGAGSPTAGRPCLTRRSVVVRFRAVPGARVRSVRAFVNGRRARSRVLRGRRVRVALRRRAGTQRVRIVVRQTRGLRTITKRTSGRAGAEAEA